VIPRLSSAYNFRHNDLALFRFLCDLQYQSVDTNLSFDLEAFFPGMAHYPRVELGGVVISPAKWRVKKEQEGGLSAEKLREELGLPEWIALTRHDQQLVFNLDDAGDRDHFTACTVGLGELLLQEFLLPAASLVSDAKGRPLISQFIATLVNRQEVYTGMHFEQMTRLHPQREFVTGSEWLYLKIYCPALSVNSHLVDTILPLLREVSRNGPLSWFFIRYQDPGTHIRLRIRVAEKRIGEILALFKTAFGRMVSGQLIREYQADVYRRELERYGAELITQVEQCFYASSEMVLQFLERQEGSGMTTDQFAIAGFGYLLDRLIPLAEEQLVFLRSVVDAFYREFNGDKTLKVALDSLYREQKGMFSGAKAAAASSQLLDEALNGLLAAIAGSTAQRRHALCADLVHMHLNRVYATEQRKQEMVLYYCFWKSRTSALAAARSAAVSPTLQQ
jgi:thiopeptide-type bacteriocin biosynthesis protein